MDRGLLKRIFVQREQLLDRLVDRLSTSMSSGDKHHLLLVGPRGSGKTHLVSLADWELRQNPKLADSMRISWLGEDDTFSGLIHLAFGIARSLADEYPEEFPQDFKTPVRGLPPDDAALAVLNTVIKNLKHRHLLLITENLDQTFHGLGEMGQKKLRAFLQETRRMATLATTQQLFAGVSSRNEAFFGFFDTFHLEPLTVDDAQQLIRNIAVEQQNVELIQFLDSNHARYRIRALHHLAGGNHRMYVILAEFLTRDKLDDLVTAFETLTEEMTPYFQERMRSLPDQQRQLVQSLCDAEGAMTVKELAEETFIADGNCSKQLGNLKAKGYVRSEKRGKESYYDMAEPLMRLCLEVKNQRGRPLKLVARFLKAWFPEEKLQANLKAVGGHSRLSDYCQLALQSDELSVSNRYEGLSYKAIAAAKQSDFSSAISALTEILSAYDLSADRKAWALLNRGFTHGQVGDTQAEMADYTSVIQMSDAPADPKAMALINRGARYWKSKNWFACLNDLQSFLSQPGISTEYRSQMLFAIPEPMVAIESLERVVSALELAFEQGDKQSGTYGGTPGDLISMIIQRGPSEWAGYIAAIAPLYVQHGVAEKLGQGVTKSIQFLDEGNFSATHLESWYHAWQEVGNESEELQIPLSCLRAAVDVLKSDPPTDRPLFRLPTEIRQLVRPLLRNALGDE